MTDVELGRLPLSTLRRYSAIVFPGHTEYYEPATYDLLKRYRDQGGNLVFLQANPFYRQVRLDPEHNAIVMTDYDAREGRSDFASPGSATTAAASRTRGRLHTWRRPAATTTGCAGSSAAPGSGPATGSGSRPPRATGSTRS